MNPLATGHVSTSWQINGPALRFVREHHGDSIGQLARLVGVSTSFLAALERGRRRGVRLTVLRGLIEHLELTDPRVVLADPYAITEERLAEAVREPVAHKRLRSASHLSTVPRQRDDPAA